MSSRSYWGGKSCPVFIERARTKLFLASVDIGFMASSVRNAFIQSMGAHVKTNAAIPSDKLRGFPEAVFGGIPSRLKDPSKVHVLNIGFGSNMDVFDFFLTAGTRMTGIEKYSRVLGRRLLNDPDTLEKMERQVRSLPSPDDMKKRFSSHEDRLSILNISDLGESFLPKPNLIIAVAPVSGVIHLSTMIATQGARLVFQTGVRRSAGSDELLMEQLSYRKELRLMGEWKTPVPLFNSRYRYAEPRLHVFQVLSDGPASDCFGI